MNRVGGRRQRGRNAADMADVAFGRDASTSHAHPATVPTASPRPTPRTERRGGAGGPREQCRRSEADPRRGPPSTRGCARCPGRPPGLPSHPIRRSHLALRAVRLGSPPPFRAVGERGPGASRRPVDPLEGSPGGITAPPDHTQPQYRQPVRHRPCRARQGRRRAPRRGPAPDPPHGRSRGGAPAGGRKARTRTARPGLPPGHRPRAPASGVRHFGGCGCVMIRRPPSGCRPVAGDSVTLPGRF